MCVAEGVTELVGAQQASSFIRLVEVAIEIHGATGHLPAVIGPPPAKSDRIG